MKLSRKPVRAVLAVVAGAPNGRSNACTRHAGADEIDRARRDRLEHAAGTAERRELIKIMTEIPT